MKIIHLASFVSKKIISAILIIGFYPIMKFYRGDKIQINLIYDRFGHFLLDTEAFLIKHFSEKPKNISNIFCVANGNPPNRYILNLWAKKIYILKSRIAFRIISKVGTFFCGKFPEKVSIRYLYNLEGGDYSFFNKENQVCHFSNKDKKKGELLTKLLDIKNKWITIHNRDNVYLDIRFKKRLASEDYRNFSIEDLYSAADLFYKNGFSVIRLGNVVSEKVDPQKDFIVDYPNSKYVSDFADVYLGGSSCGHFGAESGIQGIPMIFRKPVALVNGNLPSVKLHALAASGVYLVIFKRIRRRKDGRLLSLREVFREIPNGYSSANFDDSGLEVVSNSSEEIREFADEFLGRINNSWVENEGDLCLQERFWKIICETHGDLTGKKINCKVGSSFLRDNLYLLD